MRMDTLQPLICLSTYQTQEIRHGPRSRVRRTEDGGEAEVDSQGESTKSPASKPQQFNGLKYDNMLGQKR